MGEPQIYRLEADAAPESLAVARLFVGAVLRLCGAEESDVEDAKLAITELGTATVVASNGGRIAVTIERRADTVGITLDPFATVETEAPDPVEVALALFPAAAIDPESHTARFSVELVVH